MRAHAARSDFSGGVSLLAETRLHLLWWTERPDRDDAHGVGREEKMDQRNAFSSRAEFLHAASRPGSATARHLHRLAFAQNARRHCCRRALCHSIHLYSLGAQLRLCRIRPRSVDRRDLLRIETGRARDCRRGCHSHREQGAQERRHVGNRRSVRLSRSIFFTFRSR